MKIYIEGIGLQDMPTDEANALKARQSPTAAWRLEVLRQKRNQLLAETDYMANSDVTMSNDWKKYRQDLRDITKTFKSMGDKDFKFPTKPTD